MYQAKIPVRSTKWQIANDAWRLDDFEFVTSKLMGPDGRPMWRQLTFYDVAALIADAFLVLKVEKGGATADELAPRRKALMFFMIHCWPGARRLEATAEHIDAEAMGYRLAVERFKAPEHDPESRRGLRESKAAVKRRLAAEIERNAQHPAEADFCSGHRELLAAIARHRVSPSRFVLPWHEFARKMFRAWVPISRDPDVRTRSRDALAVRFVQQVLEYVGKHVARPAILKVLSKEIASTDALFKNGHLMRGATLSWSAARLMGRKWP
jgi:hypothetical protein